MDGELRKQLEKLIELVDDLSTRTNDIGVSFNGKKGSEIGLKGFVYLDLIQRINGNLEALSVLLNGLNKSPVFKSSIAIILRTCLSDVLTGYYLYTFMNDEKSFENEVKVLGIDYAKYMIDMIKDEPKYYGNNISEADLEKSRKKMKKQCAKQFDEVIKDYDQASGELVLYRAAEIRLSSDQELFFTKEEKTSKITDRIKYERLIRFGLLNQSYSYMLIRFYAQFHHYGYFNRKVSDLNLLSNFAFVSQSFYQINLAIHSFGIFIEADSKLLEDVKGILYEFEGFHGLAKRE